MPNPNPQLQSRRRPVSPRSRHYSNPEFPKKNVLEGMVRESRVRPPHPPPLPTPSPGGDEGPSPPRRRQRSHRCRGDGSQQPRASGPGPSPGRGTVTGRRPLTVTTPPTAANGPAMGGERAGLGVLESPTQVTAVMGLHARPPDPFDESRLSWSRVVGQTGLPSRHWGSGVRRRYGSEPRVRGMVRPQR